jgi:hypothetical protein
VNHFRHLRRITMTLDMHVHHVGSLSQQVVVQSGLFYAALLKFQHDRLNFILSEDKVAHHHR